jgi:rare lipoprotein A
VAVCQDRDCSSTTAAAFKLRIARCADRFLPQIVPDFAHSQFTGTLSAIISIPPDNNTASGGTVQSQNICRRLSYFLFALLLIAAAPASSYADPQDRRLAALDAQLIEAGVFGAASTYDPWTTNEPEGIETASGELYDPEAWTAAIRTDLRGAFGGIRYGHSYRASFALVECGERRAIVRINDVGPLKPGRIIDLNTRTMRYFDPTTALGVVQNVTVTPLPGENWGAGPLDDDVNGSVVLSARSR